MPESVLATFTMIPYVCMNVLMHIKNSSTFQVPEFTFYLLWYYSLFEPTEFCKSIWSQGVHGKTEESDRNKTPAKTDARDSKPGKDDLT